MSSKTLFDMGPRNCAISLQWRHNERDDVSNHQPQDCLFRRRSKKTSKLRVTGLCTGIHRSPVNSPHKRPVTGKMFPFDDVIMYKYGSWIMESTTTQGASAIQATLTQEYNTQVPVSVCRGRCEAPMYIWDFWNVFEEKSEGITKNLYISVLRKSHV